LPTVKIAVRYYGMLHDLVGKRSEILGIDEKETASELVKMITSKHGKKVEDFVFEPNGKLRSGLAFAVNGNSIDTPMLSRIRCGEITEFVILPPISGGL
jgi:molybdopterin converting factor small subunit